MSNYTPTGKPIDETRGLARQVRSEFSAIAAAIQTKTDVSALAAMIADVVQDLPANVITTASASIASNYRHVIAFAGAAALTAPASPVAGDLIEILVGNGLRNNTVDLGAKSIVGPVMEASGVITLDAIVPWRMLYVGSIGKWVLA